MSDLTCHCKIPAPTDCGHVEICAKVTVNGHVIVNNNYKCLCPCPCPGITLYATYCGDCCWDGYIFPLTWDGAGWSFDYIFCEGSSSSSSSSSYFEYIASGGLSIRGSSMGENLIPTVCCPSGVPTVLYLNTRDGTFGSTLDNQSSYQMNYDPSSGYWLSDVITTFNSINSCGWLSPCLAGNIINDMVFGIQCNSGTGKWTLSFFIEGQAPGSPCQTQTGFSATCNPFAINTSWAINTTCLGESETSSPCNLNLNISTVRAVPPGIYTVGCTPVPSKLYLTFTWASGNASDNCLSGTYELDYVSCYTASPFGSPHSEGNWWVTPVVTPSGCPSSVLFVLASGTADPDNTVNSPGNWILEVYCDTTYSDDGLIEGGRDCIYSISGFDNNLNPIGSCIPFYLTASNVTPFCNGSPFAGTQCYFHGSIFNIVVTE